MELRACGVAGVWSYGWVQLWTRWGSEGRAIANLLWAQRLRTANCFCEERETLELLTRSHAHTLIRPHAQTLTIDTRPHAYIFHACRLTHNSLTQHDHESNSAHIKLSKLHTCDNDQPLKNKNKKRHTHTIESTVCTNKISKRRRIRQLAIRKIE